MLANSMMVSPRLWQSENHETRLTALLLYDAQHIASYRRKIRYFTTNDFLEKIPEKIPKFQLVTHTCYISQS